MHVVLGAQWAKNKNKVVSYGHIKILKKLLELGAEVNVRDFFGCSPLFCSFGHDMGKQNKTLTIVSRMLLEEGADPNIQESDFQPKKE